MRSIHGISSRTVYAALAAFLLALAPGARACEMPAPDSPGALYACPMQGEAQGGYCPLEHTDVQAAISGDIARVTVTQRFTNPLNVPIEAIYTFPLSEKSAVDRMHMKIGDRIIVGNVQEREAARQAYEQARSEGKTAALLDQQRPNIFTQSVANVQPGDVIEVTLSYVEYLKHEADNFEFSFPMVVGPRYIPGGALPSGAGTTQVPDASKITPPLTPEGTRAGHDISLELLLDAGMPLGDVRSELHKVQTERPSDSRAIVRLDNQKELPNRDFVLKYNVRGEGIREGLLTHSDGKEGFFTLWLQPPAEAAPRESVAKELVFVIDCSGSMGGFPIEKAKATMARCIQDLSPADSFNLISFAGGTGYCFKQTLPASEDNKRQALAYLGQLQGGGGTEMMGAVHAALAPPFAKDRLRTVCFMTDGFIGNDMDILAAIQRGAPYARVFSFGIGNSVNRFLIEGMAREGRGEAQIVTLESNGDAAAKRFSERIKRPVLTNISLDFAGLDGVELSRPAAQQPDLFAGQPLRISGRYTHAGNGTIIVRGETAAGPFERRVDVQLPANATEHDALASLWARERIDTLMAADWQGMQAGQPKPELKQQIIALGTRYSLVTQYTSFIAIEEARRGQGRTPVPVNVPVEMPDGVSYEGIVGNRNSGGGFGGSAAGFPAAQRQLQSLGYLNAPTAASPAPMPEMKVKRAAPALGGMPGVAGAMPEPAPQAASRVDVAPREVMKDEKAGQAKEDDATDARKAMKPAAREEEAKGLAKLDPALRGLAAKLVNGNYDGEGLHVANNQVELAVYLHDTRDATLAALRALGLEVRSVSHAAAKVLVRVRVSDLARLAALDSVVRLAPPSL